jgi:hypothetical protein
MRTPTILAALVALGAAAAPPGQSPHQPRAAPPLGLLLIQTDHPLKPGTGLPRALSDMGVLVRDGHVMFGIEVELRGDREPALRSPLRVGGTVGAALRQILARFPGYTFQVVSPHLINVHPVRAEKDPQNPLNTLVPRLDLNSVHPTDVWAYPEDYIPALRAKLRPAAPGQPYGYGGERILAAPGAEPTVTLHLKNVSVRQIFNAISEKTEAFPTNFEPWGWVCRYATKAQPPLKPRLACSAHSSVLAGSKK